MIYTKIIESEIGPLTIRGNDEAICEVHFGAYGEERSGPILEQAAQQLREYFAGERREFDLTLEPKGTDFQISVWKALLAVPYGETRSYGEIAAAIGNPKASRAVGMANNKNPIAIIIPCHRIVGANGSLTGYAGGLDTKRTLLALEAEKSK